MVRKLKHHEQKLLKKTDFITYKQVSRELRCPFTYIQTWITDTSARTMATAITMLSDGT